MPDDDLDEETRLQGEIASIAKVSGDAAAALGADLLLRYNELVATRHAARAPRTRLQIAKRLLLKTETKRDKAAVRQSAATAQLLASRLEVAASDADFAAVAAEALRLRTEVATLSLEVAVADGAEVDAAMPLADPGEIQALSGVAQALRDVCSMPLPDGAAP